MSPDVVQAAVVAEREECARAVCGVCRREGPPAAYTPGQGPPMMVHTVDAAQEMDGEWHAQVTVFCAAAAIWRRGLEV